MVKTPKYGYKKHCYILKFKPNIRYITNMEFVFLFKKDLMKMYETLKAGYPDGYYSFYYNYELSVDEEYMAFDGRAKIIEKFKDDDKGYENVDITSHDNALPDPDEPQGYHELDIVNIEKGLKGFG